MRKRYFILFFLFIYLLVACDEASTDPVKNDEINQSEQQEEDNYTDEPNTNEEEASNEENPNDTYVKDGDVINYFMLFGTMRDCTEEWGYNETATCYEIETVDNGLDITMRYYYIEGTYYETFDFIAKTSSATLIIQLDYMARIDTSVSYSNNNQYVKGFLQYNGLDQTPIFELNTNYQYEDWGNNGITDMQTMLNTLIPSIDAYYKENIDASIVTTEDN